jgi:hypothetical protein
VAHHSLVEQRMEQLREELLASDPAELRRKATGALARILAGQLDPACRLTALTTLNYLDRREQAAVRADREALRDAVVQLATLDRLERGNRDRTPSRSAKQPETNRPQVNIDDIVNELERLVEEQQRGSGIELPSVAVTGCESRCSAAGSGGNYRRGEADDRLQRSTGIGEEGRTLRSADLGSPTRPTVKLAKRKTFE